MAKITGNKLLTGFHSALLEVNCYNVTVIQAQITLKMYIVNTGQPLERFFKEV